MFVFSMYYCEAYGAFPGSASAHRILAPRDVTPFRQRSGVFVVETATDLQPLDPYRLHVNILHVKFYMYSRAMWTKRSTCILYPESEIDLNE